MTGAQTMANPESSLQDPKLLYAVDGIQAYHIANGSEESLTPAGPQTLSLLMVPTSSGFADPSGISTGEEDFYLHLHLPPELDLPLPATTQIYHQPPSSYLIPRWDLGRASGAFTRIEFPPPGSRAGVQEDVDTFETILAQCTAFLERAPPPAPRSSKAAEAKAREAAGEELPPYNPADYDAGEGYVQGSRSAQNGGRIVLVDEEDGSVIGELGEGFQVTEDGAVKPGSKGTVMQRPPGRLHANMAQKQTLSRSHFLRTAARPLPSSLPNTITSKSRCILPIASRPSWAMPPRRHDCSLQHRITLGRSCKTRQTASPTIQSLLQSLSRSNPRPRHTLDESISFQPRPPVSLPPLSAPLASLRRISVPMSLDARMAGRAATTRMATSLRATSLVC